MLKKLLCLLTHHSPHAGNWKVIHEESRFPGVVMGRDWRCSRCGRVMRSQRQVMPK